MGLYVRMTLWESEVFEKTKQSGKLVNLPVASLFKKYYRVFLAGIFLATAGYVLFYILAAFAQIYAKSPTTLSPAGYAQGLGFSSQVFTKYLLISSFVFAIAIALSGILSDKWGCKPFLIGTTLLIIVFGFTLPLFLENGTETSLFMFLMVGMILMGATFGPMSVILPELFPTEIRYTGSSLSYNVAGILGASVATIITLQINANFGLMGVGIYLALNGVLSLVALLRVPETGNSDKVHITDE
ncbi:MFS transporter [Otariodibacter oris]|uniref:MFS transporter n=2 Tax=Otariodibacter oris TaxID=1032623 RepID=UPI0030B85E36